MTQVALKPTSIMDHSRSRSRSPIAAPWPPPARHSMLSMRAHLPTPCPVPSPACPVQSRGAGHCLLRPRSSTCQPAMPCPVLRQSSVPHPASVPASTAESSVPRPVRPSSPETGAAEPPQLDFHPNRMPIDFLDCPCCEGTTFGIDADKGLLKCLHRPCGHTFPPELSVVKELMNLYYLRRATNEFRAEASYLVPIVLYH